VPTYEYRCDACGATYEVFQKMSDTPLETCDACGGALRKVLYPVAVHFKGSGFYTTDYGRSGSGPRTGRESEGDGEKGDGEKAGADKAGGAGKTAGEAGGAGKTADGGKTAGAGASGEAGASSATAAGDGSRKREKQPAG